MLSVKFNLVPVYVMVGVNVLNDAEFVALMNEPYAWSPPHLCAAVLVCARHLRLSNNTEVITCMTTLPSLEY